MTAGTAKPKLRPYQKAAVQAAAEAFVRRANIKRGAIVLPTGAGKTFLGAYFNNELIKQLKVKIVWVAHRDELIKQAVEEHVKLNPDLNYTLWTSASKDCAGDIIFTSIQSSKGLAASLEAKYGTGKYNLVLVIDECHHFAKEGTGKTASLAKDYTNMYAQLEKALFNAKMCRFSYGLTATAVRLDGRPLGYEQIIYQMRFVDGVQAGFLARPMYYEMRTKQQFHMDTVKKAGGKDYTDVDLQKLDNPVRNKKIAGELTRNIEWMHDSDGNRKLDDNGKPLPGWGKTLVFGVNVQHCYHLAEEIKEMSPDLDVRVVTGGTSDEERREFRTWLAEGDTNAQKVAINCLVFTEGFDEPTINTIFLTRPTMSEALWMQMVGRGARIIKDRKTGAFIKDKFNLVSVMDEIGRYGALVKEWHLALMDPRKKLTQKKKKAAANKVLKKRRLIGQIQEAIGGTPLEMDDATLIDVQAILIAATPFGQPVGLPLDRDRIDVLRMLQEYIPKCYVETLMKNGSIKVEFSREAFRNSYSHCVPANEFDHETWRTVSWAYYWHFIRKQEKVRNSRTGRYETCFKMVPMIRNEEISGEVAVAAANARINEAKRHSEEKNEAFNLRYGDRHSGKELYQKIMTALAMKGLSKETLFLEDHARRVIVKDRRVDVKLNVSAHGNKKILRTVGALNKKGTEVMQEMLQDSVCEFRLSPKKG